MFMPAVSESTVLTLADLLRRFGPIPAYRVRTSPAPGTATEDDMLAVNERGEGLCELVDGVLVEKAMGYYESRLAAVLIHYLESFLDKHDLGIVVGADGASRLAPGRVRIPDVSFVSWARLPGRQIPGEPIPRIVPDLAVEVVSQGNTREEMDLKREEYFRAGVRLVWEAYPQTRVVKVFTALDRCTTAGDDGALDGGEVLPGFKLSVRDWFARAERSSSGK
jgi:Uma2 family endonuclease